MAVIELQDLVIRRGSFELAVPRWAVEPGQVVGVVGPNGAGKTTLLQAIAGLRGVSEGTVRTLGMDPRARCVDVRRRLGFMAPELPVFDLPLRRLLALVAGYYPRWDHDFAAALLDRFELSPKARSSKLSLGQGTRLRLLLALAFHPELLVLDEPVSGLDVAGRRSLLTLLEELCAEEQRTLLVSSHRLADVQRLSTHLLVLDRGRVVQAGELAALVEGHGDLEEAFVAWTAR
jgi:ABC-2 type transport system ATP-binding protein